MRCRVWTPKLICSIKQWGFKLGAYKVWRINFEYGSTYEFIYKCFEPKKKRKKRGVTKVCFQKRVVGKEIKKEIWCRVWTPSFMCSINEEVLYEVRAKFGGLTSNTGPHTNLFRKVWTKKEKKKELLSLFF